MKRPPEYTQFDRKTKYMTFELIDKKPKTTVWLVVNNTSGSLLGGIEWYPPWRQYVFMPEGQTVFNNGCLKDIQDFLTELNSRQKAGSY